MYNRVVVPIYDSENKNLMVGCSGRSIFERCGVCNLYHDKNISCEQAKTKSFEYSKWKHSAKFNKNLVLYNYWFAKQAIQKTKTIIITESPGNIWRLAESKIDLGVATFGVSLSDYQQIILETSGVMNVVLALDRDENGVGQNAENELESLLSRMYNVWRVNFPDGKNDIGELSVEQTKSVFGPILEKVCK